MRIAFSFNVRAGGGEPTRFRAIALTALVLSYFRRFEGIYSLGNIVADDTIVGHTRIY